MTAGTIGGVDWVAILGRRGRRPLPYRATDCSSVTVLRSSAAADGGRCRAQPVRSHREDVVAILGRRGRRPLPVGEVEVPDETVALRSSAAADGGRCAEPEGRPR